MSMLGNMEEEIRARAHRIWEQSGRLEGQADEHWRIAECEVALLVQTTQASRTQPMPAPSAPKRRNSAKAGPAKRKMKVGSAAH